MPETKKHIVFSLFFALLFVLLAVPAHYKAYPVIAFFVVLLWRKPRHFDRRFFLVNTLLYWGLLLALSYSSNRTYGMSYVFETQVLLIAFPLVFSLMNPRQFPELTAYKEKFFLVYIFMMFLYSLSPFHWAFPPHNYTFQKLLHHYPGILGSPDFGLFSIHPIYMAAGVGWALILSLYLIFTTRKENLRKYLVLASIYFLVILFHLARMSALAGIFLSLPLLIYFYKKEWFWPATAIIIAGIITLFVVPNTRKRIQEVVNVDKTEVLEKSSSGKRLRIYRSSLKSIKKSPVFGYGLGSHKDALLQQYQRDGETDLRQRELSSHNQYLSFLLIGGIILLLIYLAMIGISLRWAFQSRNYLMLVFLVYFGTIFLFENYLEREDGVVVFALFFTYLNWLSRYEHKK